MNKKHKCKQKQIVKLVSEIKVIIYIYKNVNK